MGTGRRAAVIHAIFETQAKQTPEAIAAVFENEALSYRELNQRANGVARALIAQRVGPGQLVGIYAERSLELLAGILGILKAGGAYVPFDPEYPPERIAFMIEDAKIPVILARTAQIGELPACGAKVLPLDEFAACGAEADPECAVASDNLAYVIYTSGSTGKPKGVMVTHRNVTRLFEASEKWFHFDERDVWTLFHSPAFDFSVWEIWGALLHGGRLVVVSHGVSRSPDLFYRLLANERITVLNQTPSAFKQLLHAEAEAPLPLALRVVVFGGEALYPDVLRPWFDRHGDQSPQMVNMYGITETTVHVTYRRLLREDMGQGSVIGVPLEDLEVRLLDEAGRPVPDGEPGEMHVGGAGVACGYLNRPELTTERFYCHPANSAFPGPWYRSGDLARRLPGGELEYLGRIDHQVKIRGFRVELGEIETAILRFDGVVQTAVIAREERSGDQRLTAYIVPGKGAPLAIQPLHAFLKKKLPSYMVPAELVLLDALPINAHGKLDRTALPAPDRNDLAATPKSISPDTPEEEAVAAIWRELLHVEQIGVDDDFFELGGHSLLGAQVISRLRAALRVDIPVGAIFEAPTIRKLAALLRSRRQEPAPATATEPIPRIPPGMAPPLSLAQQRLWLLHQLEDCCAAYNLPVATSLRGVLDLPALEAGLNAIVRRHDILRTRFPAGDEARLQLASELHLCIPVTDLSTMPPRARKAEVHRRLKEDALSPFDLAAGPLIRASLLRCGPAHHVLLFNVHHLVADGWSLNILFREWTALYGAFCKGLPSPLPPLPIQYADFAAWQRMALQNEGLDSQLAYWKKRLRDVSAFELLPDLPRPGEHTFHGARQSLMLPEPLAQAVQALGHRENATLFMTLLAVFKLWLFRCTQQADICVGTPIAMRNRVELEKLIGFFINTLVLRTDLSGNPGFRELLQRVRETALGAYACQDVPFDKLVEELNPDRSRGGTPFFHIFFNVLNYAEERVFFPGLRTRRLPDEVQSSKFDLTLYVQERNGGGIELTAIYNMQLYRPERISSMLHQMEHLLWQIVANPEEKITALSLVSPRERHILPDPTQPLAKTWEGSVCEMFERQAERRPTHPAVIDEVGVLTYTDLRFASDQLARRLTEAGCKRGDLNAIYAHRSRSIVAALLGVFKTGGACVILDPAFPSSRLIEYLQLAHPRGFLQLDAAGPMPEALEQWVADHAWNYRLRLAVPGASPHAGNAPANPFRSGRTGPDDLAYVAFTSGSTGAPKAIAATHGPLSHFVHWHARMFGLRESDRFSMLSGVSHDPLLRDIFTPLSLGATIVIPTSEELHDPVRLNAWLREKQISVAHLTPPLAQLLDQAPRDERTPLFLRYAFFGGDRLTRRHVAHLRQRAPQVHCVNFYGSTETPQAMSYHHIDPDSGETGSVPLGRGIDNVQLLLLTEGGQLAGIYESAEVCIRTPHLSLGYVHDEELTRARFIENAFTGSPGDRIYRTGDMGRYRADGEVEFLGRIDRQTKIRGFRIEPAEIEAQLEQHPLVAKCHVRVQDGEEKQLVAYVMGRDMLIPDMALQLQKFLRERLPLAMVPSAFVALDAIPLTPNGKVDAGSLPKPSHESPHQPRQVSEAPIDALEYQLQKIWEELLGTAPIGIRENFFDLGGHSLLAARLFARIHKLTGCNLPLASLFQSPTIASLAELIRNGQWEPLWAALVPIQPNGTKTPLFLVHPVGGNVLGYRDLASHLDKDLPVFGLQAMGLRGTEHTLQSVQEMAAHYLKEIRALRPQGPYLLVGYSSGGIVAYEMAQQLRAQGEAVPLLALLDTAPSGAWKKPVPVRIAGHLQVLMELPWERKIHYAMGKLVLVKRAIATALRRSLRLGSRKRKPAEPQVLEEVRMSNRCAILRYRPAVYPGRVILFRARQRHEFYDKFQREPDESWRAFAAGGLVIRDVPGDHGQLLGEPNVSLVAKEMQTFLNEALACKGSTPS